MAIERLRGRLEGRAAADRATVPELVATLDVRGLLRRTTARSSDARTLTYELYELR